MKYLVRIACCVIWTSLLGCEDNKSSQTVDDTNTVNQILSDTIEIHQIIDGVYCLKIETNLSHETVSKSGFYPFDKLVKNQSLIFFKDDIELHKENFIVPSKKILLSNSDSLMVIENVLYELGVVIGKKGNLFSVKGTGLCNSCPEYFALYSLEGNCLWMSYSSKYESIKQEGNISDVFESYGIDSTKWYDGAYRVVEFDF